MPIAGLGDQFRRDAIAITEVAELLCTLVGQGEVGRHETGEVPHIRRALSAEEELPSLPYAAFVEEFERRAEEETAGHRRIEAIRQVRGKCVREVMGFELAQHLIHSADLPVAMRVAPVSEERVRFVNDEEAGRRTSLGEGICDPLLSSPDPFAQ